MNEEHRLNMILAKLMEHYSKNIKMEGVKIVHMGKVDVIEIFNPEKHFHVNWDVADGTYHLKYGGNGQWRSKNGIFVYLLKEDNAHILNVDDCYVIKVTNCKLYKVLYNSTKNIEYK